MNRGSTHPTPIRRPSRTPSPSPPYEGGVRGGSIGSVRCKCERTAPSSCPLSVGRTDFAARPGPRTGSPAVPRSLNRQARCLRGPRAGAPRAGFRVLHHRRPSMSTSATAGARSAYIAWGPLLWIAGLHLGAPRGVPRLLHLAGPRGLPGLSLADRRAGHLPDLSPAADPSELRHPAEVARIPADRPRLLRLGGRARRLGRRPPQAPRPFGRRTRCPQPQPRLRLGAHALVDDARRHRPPHAPTTVASGPRTSTATRSTASSTGTTSSSRS